MRARQTKAVLNHPTNFPPYTPYQPHPAQYQHLQHIQYAPYLYQQPIIPQQSPQQSPPAKPDDLNQAAEPPTSPIAPGPNPTAELRDYFNWLQTQPHWSSVELITKLNHIADTLLENDYDLEALRNKNEISNSI
jgi:hypothetical protein